MVVNLHIYPSPFKFESRIIRESNVLLNEHVVDKIIIASGWAPGLKKNEYVTENIQVRRFKTLSDPLIKINKIFLASRYIELYVYITLFYLFKPIQIINAHSLMVLPIGVWLKQFNKKRKLIYDAHELETERIGLKGKSQKYSKYFERRFIKYCDSIIVVGNYIRKWYISEYQLAENKIYTVRNISDAERITRPDNNHYLREHFKLDKDDVIFIYQGLLSQGRGIDIYIDAFKNLKGNFKLVLMGYGPLEAKIRETCKECNNIFFHEAVKPDEIVDVTSSADVGLCLIENYCLSYYYSLPNKLFEYINSKVPVIVSNFPEMSELINQNNVGWSVNPKVYDLVALIDSADFLQQRLVVKDCTTSFFEKNNWQIEQTQLLTAYGRLNLEIAL